MKNLILYRILSYILLILAGFLSLIVLVLFVAALSNPFLFLSVFVMACVVIYSYTSWRFLTRGIDYNQPCKPALRDLIRVNAIVSIVVAILCLINSYMVLADPKLLETALQNAVSNGAALQGQDPAQAEHMMRKMLLATIKFMVVYGILLLVHSFFTFRLLKQYRHIFEPPHNGPVS